MNLSFCASPTNTKTMKITQPISVTFDSNVWENIVDEDKRTKDAQFIQIYNLIKC